MIIKCILAGMNCSGEPDLFFANIVCSKKQYECGEHYDAIKEIAGEEGYEEPCVTFDENDAAGKALLPLFKWITASTYKI